MNLSASAVRKLGIIRNAFYIYNNDKINTTCYRSYVLPLLEYCSSVWTSAAVRDLPLLGKVVVDLCFLMVESMAELHHHDTNL